MSNESKSGIPDLKEWSLEKLQYTWLYAEENMKEGHPEWSRETLYYRVNAVKNRIIEEIIRRNDANDMTLEEIEAYLGVIGL